MTHYKWYNYKPAHTTYAKQLTYNTKQTDKTKRNRHEQKNKTKKLKQKGRERERKKKKKKITLRNIYLPSDHVGFVLVVTME